MPKGTSRTNKALPGKDEKGLAVRATDRYQAMLNGTLSVEDLDDDEIIRGQLRDKNGQFRGSAPLLIPRVFHQRAVKELMHRADMSILSNLTDAQKAVADIMNNPKAPAIARLEAAKYMWERIQGKIPDKVELDTTIRKFETLIEGGHVLVDVDIEDAEIVEEDDEGGSGPGHEAEVGPRQGEPRYEVVLSDGDDGVPTVRRTKRRRKSGGEGSASGDGG